LPSHEHSFGVPGRSSRSKYLQYVGIVAAFVAIVGSVAPGWEFGGTDHAAPLVLGGACAIVAAGWALHRLA
jgi:hypothetical protein